MATDSERLVTTIKVRELEKQRNHTLAVYDQVAAMLAAPGTPQSRITQVREQLEQLTFARQPLHPNAVNLSLLSDAAAPASPEITTWWAEQLEREVASGRLRADVVALFGALFEEWQQADHTPPADAQRSAQLMSQVTASPATPDYAAMLDMLFDFPHDATRQAKLTRQLEADPEEVDSDTLRGLLRRIASDRFYGPQTRDEARSLLNDTVMLKEISDALNILLSEPTLWRWPAAGVVAEAQWARTKWRLFLHEDLLTACLHMVLADHWQSILELFCTNAHTQPFSELQQLARSISDPPPHIKRMQTAYSAAPHSIDIWHPVPRPLAPNDPAHLDFYGQGLFSKREHASAALRRWQHSADYAEDYTRSIEAALGLINAELQLGAHVYPDQPLFVLKTDLRDYYPSLNHALILELLQRIGFSEAMLATVAAYLAVPLQTANGVQPQTRGVPNHRPLSDLLGELVLRMGELYIARRAHVQIVRFVDDITLLAADAAELERGWQALQEWCAAFGLELNLAKTGAQALRAPLPASLPQMPPTWLFVTLNSAGEWCLDQADLQAYLEQTTSAINVTPAILDQIDVYNGMLSYLHQACGLRARLGERHRNEVRTLLWRYARDLPGLGCFNDHIRSLIVERFQATTVLPEGWLHWPITAGGLGIQQPLITAHSYQRAWDELEPVTLPTLRERWWQQTSNDCNAAYHAWMSTLTACEPESNSVLTALTNDFIARGNEVSSGRQEGLKPYWRWVLALYGPQILEQYGSFRFLFTELVPLRLIARKSAGRVQVPDA